MTHIWTQTITINKDLAKQLIEQQTLLPVLSIEALGEGWDNIAYLINKEFVFRFPKREMGVDCMENEIAILPYIKTKVSFPFSCPEYIGKSSKLYPASFAGYKILPGSSLSDTAAELIDNKNFAQTLALWLKELHSVKVLKEHGDQLKGNQDWRYDFKGQLQRSKERILQYESFFDDAGFKKNELFESIENLSQLACDHIEKKSYIQGDLYSRHLLVETNKNVSGIIDWGDIHIGNPGIDLSVGIMIFSNNQLQEFFNTYGDITTEMKSLALLRAFCHPIALLPYCYERNEEHLKQWTILALKKAIEVLNSFK